MTKPVDKSVDPEDVFIDERVKSIYHTHNAILIRSGYDKSEAVKLFAEMEALVVQGKVRDANEVVGVMWAYAMLFASERTEKEKERGLERQDWINLAIKVAKGVAVYALDEEGWGRTTFYDVKREEALDEWNKLAKKEWLETTQTFENAFSLGRHDLIETMVAAGVDLNAKAGWCVKHVNSDQDFSNLLFQHGWNPVTSGTNKASVLCAMSEVDVAIGRETVQLILNGLIKHHPTLEYVAKCEVLKGRVRGAWTKRQLEEIWEFSKGERDDIRENSDINPSRCFFECPMELELPKELKEELVRGTLDQEVPFILGSYSRGNMSAEALQELLDSRDVDEWTPNEWAMHAVARVTSGRLKMQKDDAMRFIKTTSWKESVEALCGFWLKHKPEWEKMMFKNHYTTDEIRGVSDTIEREFLLSEVKTKESRGRRLAL
jgi:hypothetical protein